MPLLWTRQPDTIGVLGLAINTCAERDGHAETVDRIRGAARGGARPLADAARRSRTRSSSGSDDAADAPADPHRRHRGGHRCLSSTVNGGRLRRARRGRHVARRSAARRARRSPARRSPATKGTAARARCSSTACRRSRASRSCTPSATRGDDDRRAARPSDGRTRSCAPTRCSAASARPARSSAPSRSSTRRRSRSTDEIRHRDGRQPLPLRHVPEDRGGDSHVARLIRTEKEVEGRYEEVWLVVEEDALEQWPAGPRDVVGRPAARIDGLARARGEARLHRRPAAARDAAHRRAALARTRTRASTRIDLAPALAAPGVRAAIGPGELDVLVERVRLPGRGDRRRLRRHATRRRARRSRSIDVEWEQLEPLLDPDEAVARGELARRAARERARRPRARPRRGGRRRRGDLPHAGRAAQLDGDAPVRLPLGRRQRSRSTSRRSTSGASATRSREQLGTRRPTRCASSATTWAAASARRTAADDYTFIAIELAKRTRPAGALRAHAPRGEHRRRQPQRDDPAADVGARADGTLTALGGEYVNAIGWRGWTSPVEGPMQMLYACDEREDDDVGREAQPPADEGVPRAGLRRGDVRARVACSTSSRPSSSLDPLELRRRNHADARPDGGRARTRARTCSSATAAPSRTGSAGTRCARARPRPSSAASAWRRRSGTAAAARRATRGSASARTAARPSSPRCRTSAPARSTAMAQIAAEELGIPLEHVTVSLGDSARGPFASISAGSSTTPSMGPAVRAAAADARRQIEEIAGAAHGEAALDGDRSTEIVGLLEDAQILGKGARGPNPAGMQVLTFGVQVAEVAVDVETGEVRVERIAAMHDVGRVINPLGASSQIEGGIIQGIGHTLSEHRLHDPRTGQILTTSARRLQAADDRRRARDRQRADRRARHAADEPRLEGARRAADRPGRRGDRERDPRRDRRRGALAADLARGDAARAARGRARRRRLELRRASSLETRRRDAAARRHGARAAPAQRARPRRDARRHPRRRAARASTAPTIGAGTTLAELECDPQIPEALREACRLAASAAAPQRGLARREPAPVDPLLVLAAQVALPPPWRRRLLRAGRRAPRARDLRERLLRLGAPLRRRRRARRARRDAAHEPARAARRRPLPAPDRGRPADDDARARRAAALESRSRRPTARCT